MNHKGRPSHGMGFGDQFAPLAQPQPLQTITSQIQTQQQLESQQPQYTEQQEDLRVGPRRTQDLRHQGHPVQNDYDDSRQSDFEYEAYTRSADAYNNSRRFKSTPSYFSCTCCVLTTLLVIILVGVGIGIAVWYRIGSTAIIASLSSDATPSPPRSLPPVVVLPPPPTPPTLPTPQPQPTTWKGAKDQAEQIHNTHHKQHPNSVNLKIVSRGSPLITRFDCPDKNGTTAISTVVLQYVPEEGSAGEGSVLGDTPLALADPRLICSFESKADPAFPRVTAVVPRTTCVNSECACYSAKQNWATVALEHHSDIRFAIAFAVAESAVGSTLVLFELATLTIDEVNLDKNVFSGIEATALPTFCRLSWTS
jgi:hypothetical protein